MQSRKKKKKKKCQVTVVKNNMILKVSEKAFI